MFAKLPLGTDAISNLPAFSTEYFFKEIAYCIMHLRCGSNDQAAALFGIHAEVPMQCWEEIVYDVDDLAVGFCKFYLHPEDMVMSIITKFIK